MSDMNNDLVSANDIVTRLRERAESWADNGADAEMDSEAANEIEWLRSLCHDLYHDATCAESFCRLCGEGLREWEARRVEG